MKILLYMEKFLAVTFWSLTLFGFDLVYIGVLTVIAALIHEMGHIGAMLILNKSVSSAPSGRVYGFRIKTGVLSYKQEIIVSMAGPFVNILFSILFFNKNDYLSSFALINLMTATSNLLPIENYDGYRALYATVSLASKKEDLAARVLPKLSFVFSALICFISLYMMLTLGEGYWIFAIFLSSLISFIEKRCG